jgi:hypothetical protein
MQKQITPQNNIYVVNQITPQNNNNEWNYPISYFCIPIVCENNNVQLSCLHYTNKLNNNGCIGCGYCFCGNNWSLCGLLNKCNSYYITPFSCFGGYNNEDCCLPFCLISSKLIKSEFDGKKNLYLQSCFGFWGLQINMINEHVLPCSVCNLMGDCTHDLSPCNYGCGIGPLGFTSGGSCYPLCFDIQYGNCSIFNYLFCIGFIYSTKECDKGCSTGLPICVKKTEIEQNGQKYIQEKGFKFFIPWKVNKMV